MLHLTAPIDPAVITHARKQGLYVLCLLPIWCKNKGTTLLNEEVDFCVGGYVRDNDDESYTIVPNTQWQGDPNWHVGKISDIRRLHIKKGYEQCL